MKKWASGQRIFYEFGQDNEDFWEHVVAYASTTPWGIGEIELRLIFEAYECGRLGEDFPSQRVLWRRALKRLAFWTKGARMY